MAAAAVPGQQRDGRAGAEREGAGGDCVRAGGAGGEAAAGAAGGGHGALAAPLRRMPVHRLAQPRAMLHALVRPVAQPAAPVPLIDRLTTCASENFFADAELCTRSSYDLRLMCIPADSSIMGKF